MKDSEKFLTRYHEKKNYTFYHGEDKTFGEQFFIEAPLENELSISIGYSTVYLDKKMCNEIVEILNKFIEDGEI